MKTLLWAAVLWYAPVFAFAQTTSSAPPVYDFLTVAGIEAQSDNLSKILFAPAFQGKTEIQLERLPGTISGKYLAVHQSNLQLVNQQLTNVTAAGWELVHVSSSDYKTYYLFRKQRQ